jgi:two-component system chemotaxis response regulator CheB
MTRADGPTSHSCPAPGSTLSRAEFDAVGIGASLGGRAVLEEILAPLPADFPVPVLVVQHLHPRAPGYLPTLLGRRTRLTVKHAESGEELRAATVYVAPPGQHLLVTPEGRCLLSDDPLVCHARPAADPLFTSAAKAFGARTLGVVLTGRLRDGATGAVAIRRAGGVVLAQEPASCRAPEMPAAALSRGAVHVTLPPAAIAAALVGLVAVPGVRALFGLDAHAAA